MSRVCDICGRVIKGRKDLWKFRRQDYDESESYDICQRCFDERVIKKIKGDDTNVGENIQVT